MFSNFFLRSFRILLLPVALVYWLVITVRNWLYNKKIYKSTSFGMPIICVGNLAVGGTGKSPMVEYLIRLLDKKYQPATLSRGYKRRTKGYVLAGDTTTALDIGDEPMQFHLKFPEVPVAVGEERVVAIPLLLQDRPEINVIILDDALQHRAVQAGLNILLTDSSNLFTRDFYLPTGDLRDLKSSYKRADIIIVTKCDSALTVEEKNKITAEIKPLPTQKVFFTTTKYGEAYHIFSKENITVSMDMEVLLVTGIANPAHLKQLLEKHTSSYQLLQYPDHHIFNIDDLKEIRKKFNTINNENKIILTTEKDAVRLSKFQSDVYDDPIYVLPIEHHFLFNEGEIFDQAVIQFVSTVKPTI
jgi:tetraacyldisaccharide 4'-kinase